MNCRMAAFAVAKMWLPWESMLPEHEVGWWGMCSGMEMSSEVVGAVVVEW